MPPEVLAMLEPKAITPAVLFLCSQQAPTHRIVLAGAGCYAMVRLMESEGVYLDENERNVDGVAAHFERIGNMDTYFSPSRQSVFISPATAILAAP